MRHVLRKRQGHQNPFRGVIRLSLMGISLMLLFYPPNRPASCSFLPIFLFVDFSCFYASSVPGDLFGFGSGCR
jgi:hypothetical protein